MHEEEEPVRTLAPEPMQQTVSASSGKYRSPYKQTRKTSGKKRSSAKKQSTFANSDSRYYVAPMPEIRSSPRQERTTAKFNEVTVQSHQAFDSNNKFRNPELEERTAAIQAEFQRILNDSNDARKSPRKSPSKAINIDTN